MSRLLFTSANQVANGEVAMADEMRLTQGACELPGPSSSLRSDRCAKRRPAPARPARRPRTRASEDGTAGQPRVARRGRDLLAARRAARIWRAWPASGCSSVTSSGATRGTAAPRPLTFSATVASPAPISTRAPIRIARALRSASASAGGDRVAVARRQRGRASALLYVAAIKLGAILVPLNAPLHRSGEHRARPAAPRGRETLVVAAEFRKRSLWRGCGRGR